MKTTTSTKRIALLSLALLLLLGTACPAFATETTAPNNGGLTNSNIVTGSQRLLADITKWVAIIGPAICIIAAMVFLARRAMADQQDGKMWTNRIVISIICAVAIGLVSGIISLVASYYGG